MPGTRTIVSIALACGLLSSGCLRSWDDYGHALGEPCDSDDECRSGLCAADDTGTRVCTLSCAGGSGCVPGWTCGASRTCSCEASAEVCNAIDDDCDGELDEDGVCGCGRSETCNFTDDDCDGRIDETGCGECTPRIEGCNGVDDDCDGWIDEEASGSVLCPARYECSAGRCQCGETLHPTPRDVDLLFVIDNSNSMAEEQASLVVELPSLLRRLVSGDRNGDGAPDFTPPRSIHLGVVTTDMGVGGHTVPTCDRGTFGAMLGDDGVLSSRGRVDIAGCSASYPAVFRFESGSTDLDRVASDLSCVASVGTGGCGMEQQLEAALKAVSPSVPQPWTTPGYVPPVFFASTFGHADGANLGFVRDGSALAIVMVTDEEDCSAANPGIFDPSSSEFSGDLGLRCWMYEDAALHPVERFVRGVDGRSGFLGLRARPDHLIVSVLAGMPEDAVPDPSAPDFEAILGHPEMQSVIDPTMPTHPRVAAACQSPSRGRAIPARRIVRAAQGLYASGARVSVGSICEESYGRTFTALLDDIGETLTPPPACE